MSQSGNENLDIWNKSPPYIKVCISISFAARTVAHVCMLCAPRNATVHQMKHFQRIPLYPSPVFLDFTNTPSHLNELGVPSCLDSPGELTCEGKRVTSPWLQLQNLCKLYRGLFRPLVSCFGQRFSSHLGSGLLKALLNAYVFVSVDLHR